MASNVMNRSDGRLKRNRDAAMSAQLKFAAASIPPFYESPFFQSGDVVRYDCHRDAGHIAGQGVVNRVTYFNKFYYWIWIDGTLLDFRAEDLQRVSVAVLAIQRFDRILRGLLWVLACWRGWLDRLMNFVLAWMQFDIPLVVDEMVSVRPGYVRWRLSVAADKTQDKLLMAA